VLDQNHKFTEFTDATIWKLSKTSKWFLCVVVVNFDCCRSKLYAVVVHF